jgi:hypothetical protein
MSKSRSFTTDAHAHAYCAPFAMLIRARHEASLETSEAVGNGGDYTISPCGTTRFAVWFHVGQDR